MNIAIFGRNFGNSFNGMAIQLFEELIKRDINIYINNKFLDFISKKVLYKPKVKGVYKNALPEDIKFDFVFSIGGDGTFLEAASLVGNLEIPILGINTGKLGFLSYVSSNSFLAALNLIFEKKYCLEKRMLIQIEADNKFYGSKDFCLNDFVIQKKSRLSMIKTKVYSDGNFINTYWSDGLIVSTPTGSTAYSMSCGGPIVAPQSNVFVITPIANHNLTVRPLVISANSEIKISVDSQEGKVLASLDHRAYGIDNFKEILIKRANFYINFVNLFENTYFSTLREKLMWGRDIRN
ncbi:MAG: NAD kinase [Bacteroidales bacterium]|jgi:NAD+ kinase|nr:NAD kinase [Bacteroidales bacterium]MCK9497891.1 NAD kinase [Bacteroidales bacterium]MDY0313891.1 NAD kinase [Bacteroidales bacterium]NLB86854.1 NAD kinase [Bacteroidales bacterium]